MQRGGGFYQLEVSGPVHRADPPPRGLSNPAVAMGYVSCGSLCTNQDCRLPALVSPFPNPMAIAADAFLFSWDHMELYAFPLFPAIRCLLSKLWSSQRMYVILIAPFWQSKEWFPDLLQDAISHCPSLSQLVCCLRQSVWLVLDEPPQSQQCLVECKRHSLPRGHREVAWDTNH